MTYSVLKPNNFHNPVAENVAK